ncbi:hypothetical protein WB91_21750 [bacteria symbiont BFo1 of Frankliniella occidentalis]|uniref:DUF4145 domain-containing protein n=1 Tax=Erwinia aphidicola TaxID=68334 RepID=UPI0007A82E14|nr:hypothetical protein WB91_21750 [bacteria symbiont BFo1 of Frankliniella occidentalis]
MSSPLLYTSFTEDKIPHWRCPACHNETLEIVPGSFFKEKTSETMLSQDEIWFEYDHYKMIFSCMLRCSRKACLEPVAITGKGWLECRPDYESETINYVEYFRANTFHPPLPVFIPPGDCPEDVCRQLKEISALLAAHPSAAINTMRTVLEMLLDTLSVPREAARAGKDPITLTLHRRIDEYPALLGDYKDAFMAIKWLGNQGSHSNKRIRQSHIEDACTVLDDLIQKIYSPVSAVPALVAKLSKAYAPPVKPSAGKK